MADKITDHVARAVGRTVLDLRGSEFENLVRVFAPRTQILEDAIFAILEAIRDPATASGWVLDLIGALVQAELRGSKTDAEYRLRIATAIARNKSWAVPEDLIAIVVALFPEITAAEGGPGLEYFDANDAEAGDMSALFRPASFEAADDYEPISTDRAVELMRYLARAAATRVIFTFAIVAKSGHGSMFTFDDPDNPWDDSPWVVSSVDQKTRF